MGFAYHHLDDPAVRDRMVQLWTEEWEELSARWPRGQCYGKQLSDLGWSAFEDAMPFALTEQDDDWLVQQVSELDFWLEKSPRRTKSGTTMVAYNKSDAIQRLCLGEFNIAYIRGLAHVLVDRGETHCTIYRADSAYVPRGECSAWEGQTVPVTDVIAGHRARYHPPPGDHHAWSILLVRTVTTAFGPRRSSTTLSCHPNRDCAGQPRSQLRGVHQR